MRDLAEDIRAGAPQPDEEFVARLERRVEAGFEGPGPARATRTRRGSWMFRPQLVLAASLVALVVVVGAVAMLGAGGDNDAEDLASPASRQVEAGSAGGGSSAAEPGERGSADGVEPMPSTASPAPADAVAPGDRRVVERSAALELTPGGDDFAETTGGVLRVADDVGAIVQRSTVEQREGRGYATYDLRVPGSKLDEALAQLSRLAPVRSRTASADDITAPYVSARSRLADARDERRALLKALERAKTDTAARALRGRIRDTRERIAGAEAQVRAVRARADRARVSVTVESTGTADEGGAWTAGDALDDAGRILEVVAGVTLVALAILAPLLVLALIAAGTGRIVRRRRREAALG